MLGDAGGVWAFALAAVVGIPLYVCEGEEVPLTVGLLAAGLGPGPSLTFLLGSVGTRVPTLLARHRDGGHWPPRRDLARRWKTRSRPGDLTAVHAASAELAYVGAVRHDVA